MRTSRATVLPPLILFGIAAGISAGATTALADATGNPAPPAPAGPSWTVTVPTTQPAAPAAPSWTVTVPTPSHPAAPAPAWTVTKPIPSSAAPARRAPRHLAAGHSASGRVAIHHAAGKRTGRHVAHHSTRVVVRPGDTLSALFGARWPQVAQANHLPNPDLIFPGEIVIG